MDDLRELRNRVKTRLGTITPPILVGLGKVPDGVVINGKTAKPYVIIYADPGVLDSDRLDNQSKKFRWSFQLTIASGTEDATLFYFGRVRDALTDYRLEPENRSAGQLKEYGNPGNIRRDDENLADIRYWLPLIYTHDTNRS